MMPKLSQTAEQKIMAALEMVSDQDDSESMPDKALAKAAAHHEVPLGHVPLMVRAYNTARQNHQLAQGETPEEKAATFPLASVPGVLAILLPDHEVPTTKAAAANLRQFVTAPTWYRGREQPVSEKAARYCAPPKPKAVVDPHKQIEAARRIQDDARKIAGRPLIAKLAMVRSLERLAATLRPDEAPSWTDIRKTAEALHGPTGGRVMDLLPCVFPGVIKLGKALPYHGTDEFPAIYTALKQAVASAESLVQIDTETASELKRLEKLATDLTSPFLDRIGTQAQGPSLLAAGANGEDDDNGSIDPMNATSTLASSPSLMDPAGVGLGGGGMPAGIPGMPGQPMGTGMPPMPGLMDLSGGMKFGGFGHDVGHSFAVLKARDMLDKMTGASNAEADAVREQMAGAAGRTFNDPLQDQKIQDIYSQTALANMLADDDVLKGYHPRELARAYNEISHAAPSLAKKPLLVRPLLRRYLAMGHLDTFEGGETLKNEERLRGLETPPVPVVPKPANPGGPKPDDKPAPSRPK